MSLDIYDLSRWRPITPVDYLDELDNIFATLDEPEVIKTTAQALPNGQRRIVTHAMLKQVDENGEPIATVLEPYLLVLCADQRSKAVAFVRTDQELAWA